MKQKNPHGLKVVSGQSHSGITGNSLVNDLNHAIHNNELTLHYQPHYDLATGKADTLEAMVRWPHSGAGLFYPEVFIGEAEKHGLIFALDLWVFEQACKDLNYFQKTINPNTKIALNVSALVCESIFYAQKIIEISEHYKVLLSDFKFEITRSNNIHDIRKVISFCTTLINYGVEFSLDDFGSGQSPLINLCKLPINTMKIDRQFTGSIGQSRRHEIIIRSVITMAKELGLQTIAQGIETREQYQFYQDLGCDQLQGFLLCRPKPLAHIKSAMLYVSNSIDG